jgi:hypothetical protein
LSAAWVAVIVVCPIFKIANVDVPANTFATAGLEDAKLQDPDELELGKESATAPTPQVVVTGEKAPIVGATPACAEGNPAPSPITATRNPRTIFFFNMI